MLQHCRHAGITWMRDWSAKWQTVEPEPGTWDFSQVDPQIDRVLAAQLHPLLLLPFPSAIWSSAADMEVIDRHVKGDGYVKNRSIVACPPKDRDLFRNYVARTVAHFRGRTDWVEIMNEPLYTTYAVPAVFGYELRDYLQVLQDAYQSTKAQCPDMRVIGGIGAWVESHWVQDFIDAGGLQWCDAMDIHLYPVTIDPELYEEELAATWRKMQARHEAKPIWLTEFGCYADDDPHRTPGQIGDSAMSRANWPSERAASEAIVKTAAVFLSHGIQRIFYHAGTCGPINGSSGGGIFFEYGGTPTKMYAAQANLANQLGSDPSAAAAVSRADGLRAYAFRTEQGAVAIVWAANDRPVNVRPTAATTVVDMMGNRVEAAELKIDAMPVYLRAANVPDLLEIIK